MNRKGINYRKTRILSAGQNYYFDDNFYQQKFGTTMEAVTTTFYANLVMGYLDILM